MPATNTVCLRMQDKHKKIIDYAAECCGKTRTAFIIESALEKARDMLSEKTNFVLAPEQWEEFVKILDQPPEKNPGLERLINTIPPWERR